MQQKKRVRCLCLLKLGQVQFLTVVLALYFKSPSPKRRVLLPGRQVQNQLQRKTFVKMAKKMSFRLPSYLLRRTLPEVCKTAYQLRSRAVTTQTNRLALFAGMISSLVTATSLTDLFSLGFQSCVVKKNEFNGKINCTMLYKCIYKHYYIRM